MKCPKCGNDLVEGAAFCNSCGATLQEAPVATDAETPIAEPKKKGGKLVLIIILVLFLVALGTTAGFFIGKKVAKNNIPKCEISTKNSNETKPEEDKDKKEEDDDKFGLNDKIHQDIDASKVTYSAEDDLGKNLEVVKIIYNGNRKYLEVLIKNKSKQPLAYTGYLNYYDKSGTRIDKTPSSGYVSPDSYAVLDFYNSTEEGFEKVAVTIKADTYKSTYHPVAFDKSRLTVMDTNDGLHIYYKNNTNKTFTGGLVGLFYKNNELVFFEDFRFHDVKVGDTKDNELYITSIPTYESGNVEAKHYFDRYEIFESYLYNFEDDY